MTLKIKYSYVLICLVLMQIVLTACVDKQQPTTGNPTAAPATSTAKVELIVSAAASLTDALNEIQTKYERTNDRIRLKFNFGASGALQQQIEQGAPADLFISAAAKNMQALIDKQLVEASRQKPLLLNELVVVVPAADKAPPQMLEQLTGGAVKYLAIGEPQTVPAGTYAKEALTNAKLWDVLQAKIVQGKDVRQVLTYVETGNAEAGFVYKTDALSSSKVKTAFVVDPKTYTPVEYPAGIVKATKHDKEADEFYKYLFSKEAQDIFVKYGFSLPK
ncbi:molybdate ABC transporter substrate-binding protein [Paenibacillus sp. HJGM_3]|uniref:molybdate ABC transporter substrate-binding protein n=1 Tax=Paenibacillus sp. HJGM_3 TaxID=3379816 RepID=UPI003858FABB